MNNEIPSGAPRVLSVSRFDDKIEISYIIMYHKRKIYKRNSVLQFVYLRDNLLSVLDGIEILTRVKVSFLCIFLCSLKSIFLQFLSFDITCEDNAIVYLFPLIEI